MADMNELEITDFAYNFINLISSKNNEISALKGENSRLRAAVRQLAEPGKRLTEEEIMEGDMPVYCFHIKTNRGGFWGVPLKNREGVISNTKGVYRYSDYGKTWYAFSAQPEDAADVPVGSNRMDLVI